MCFKFAGGKMPDTGCPRSVGNAINEQQKREVKSKKGYRLVNCIKQNVYLLSTLFLLLLLVPKKSVAQTLPVGSVMEEQLRLQQLLNDSLSYSFVNRSVPLSDYRAIMDQSSVQSGWWNEAILPYEEQIWRDIRFGVLNPMLQNTVNSNLPFSENNGAAWYGRGFTPELMAGGYITSDYITLTVMPHLVYQENNEFMVPRFIERDSEGEIRYLAEGSRYLAERIDRPFRFGPDSYATLDWGHSSLRLHFERIEAGISNETMWWGPAVLYPLVMSNNAPGFKHLFLGTRGPATLPFNIGQIDFRWVLGRPEDSPWFDQPDFQEEDRFLNGLNLAFSPSVIPNFTIGLTRVDQQYTGNGLTGDDVFHIFNPFNKVRFSEADALIRDGGTYRSRTSSIYARWVWPDGNMEIYGELYRESNHENFRDFLTQPLNNSGYSFGFQKLVYLPHIDFLKFNAEITNMLPGRISEVRLQSYFYSNNWIRQGHTHRGEVLGAAIGTGSTSQYLSADAYHSRLKAGLFLQRWVDNDMFHYIYNQSRAPAFGNGDIWRHRVNLNIGTNLSWKAENLLFSGHFMWTRAYNYGRFDYGNYNVNFLSFEPFDLENLQMQISVTYLF